MANQLDELNHDIPASGVDARVIPKKIPAKVGDGSQVFEIMLWVCGIIPGLIFQLAKVQAENYFRQLEQKIQHNASRIDNYLEQRVVVLQNCARLLDKAIDLDKSTYESIARYRSGGVLSDEDRANLDARLDNASRNLTVALENYPAELGAHKEILEAMRQNQYLFQEICAARELYNDSIQAWNTAIFQWPARQIVAAKNGYTTRIPFTASPEIREKAKDVFF